MISVNWSKLTGLLVPAAYSGVALGQGREFSLVAVGFDAMFVMHDPGFGGASFEDHERVWAFRHVDPPGPGEVAFCAGSAPVVGEDVNGVGVHVVLAVDGFDVVVKAELGVVDDVQQLLLWAHPAKQCRVVQDADAPSDELVELAEAAVRPDRDHDADGREVVALPEHLQVNDALEVAGVGLKALPGAFDLGVGLGVMQSGAGDAVLLGDPSDLLGVPFPKRGEQHPRLDRIQQLRLGVEHRSDQAHDLTDRLMGLGGNAGELAFVSDDLKQRFPAGDFLAGAVGPDQLVGGRRRVGGEAVDTEVLGVAIHDGVDQSVAVDDVGVDGPPIKALEAGRHQQGAGIGKVAKQPLVGLGRGDVSLVDDHDVNVAGCELGQQVVGVAAGAQGVEVGDDDVGGKELLPCDGADGARLRVKGQGVWRSAARDEGPAGQAVEDVADGLVVEGSVKGAADDRPWGDDKGAPAGERQRGEHAKGGLACTR
jgi:hypothetical protein